MTEQHAWWEEGCYCLGVCICGTPYDPFYVEQTTKEEDKGEER